FSLSPTKLPGTLLPSYHADSLLDIELAITMKLPTILATTTVAAVIQKAPLVACRKEHPSSALSIFEEGIASSTYVGRQFKNPRRPLTVAIGALEYTPRHWFLALRL